MVVGLGLGNLGFGGSRFDGLGGFWDLGLGIQSLPACSGIVLDAHNLEVPWIGCPKPNP